MKRLLIYTLICTTVGSFAACNQGPSCPAYNSVHNTRDYGYNPNNAKRAEENNKADIEAKRKAALSPGKRRKTKSSLFPKGMIRR